MTAVSFLRKASNIKQPYSDVTMTVRKGDQIELDISHTGFGGKGIAKIDGFTIFVNQAVPGDRVLAAIVKKKKSHAEAKVREVLSPSPFRVEAPCLYSGFCGGCTWQFLRYDKQLEYKRLHVVEALRHIGGIEDVNVLPTLPSDAIFAYRNKMEFSCSDRRWVLPEQLDDDAVDRDFALGLHVPGTFDKVLDIDACLLQPDRGNEILGFVKAYMKTSGLPAYGLRSHEGFWRFLVVRHSLANDQWLVNIVTSAENRDVLMPLAADLMRTFPDIGAVVNNITARKSGVAVGEVEIPLAGRDHLEEHLGPYRFAVSANSFFQTNTRGAVKLYDKVKNFAALTGRERVLDLYSGTGTIPIWMADAAASVTGIEIVESAVVDARRNCEQNRISNCDFILGDMRAVLPEIKEKPDILIIDPPRTGMHPDVVKQVLALDVPRIVYVSCNPATLARDAGLMKDAYQVTRVQPVDMFPHTYHIESVACLEKR
jgi:23S rRNA (uracil1939-C5)-methyltransferase